jgi:hypothetical protein
MANPYLTVLEFRAHAAPRDAFVDLTDLELQYFLDAAASDVDSALATHHSLPLATLGIPASVKDAVLVMASYRALLFRGTIPLEGTPLAGRYVDIYVGKDSYLDRLARGLITYNVTIDSTPDIEEGAPIVGSVVNTRNVGLRTYYRGKEYV